MGKKPQIDYNKLIEWLEQEIESNTSRAESLKDICPYGSTCQGVIHSSKNLLRIIKEGRLNKDAERRDGGTDK